MKRCPKCGCERFYVTANIIQDWEVDKNGNFISVIDDVDVIRYPNDMDIWSCANCGYEDHGSIFNVEEEEIVYSKVDECLKVKVDGGYLYAAISGDVDYPGICVEFVADDDMGERLSRPTVLVERPYGDRLRALVWEDRDDEDYTTEIVFK